MVKKSIIMQDKLSIDGTPLLSVLSLFLSTVFGIRYFFRLCDGDERDDIQKC